MDNVHFYFQFFGHLNIDFYNLKTKELLNSLELYGQFGRTDRQFA